MPGLSDIPTLAQDWMQAWVEQDRAALGSFLAPDFALVGAAFPDRAIGRRTWLDVAVSSYRAESCTYTEPVLREISVGPPRLAAMSALWTQVARDGENDLSGRYWITDVWREGGPLGWQVVLRSSAALDTLSASKKAFALRR